MELCTKGLGSSVNQLKQRGVNLGCVRTCVVVAEERPRITLTTSFSKLFSALGLSPRAVSTSFGCRVNVAICLQVSYTWSHTSKHGMADVVKIRYFTLLRYLILVWEQFSVLYLIELILWSTTSISCVCMYVCIE